MRKIASYEPIVLWPGLDPSDLANKSIFSQEREGLAGLSLLI